MAAVPATNPAASRLLLTVRRATDMARWIVEVTLTLEALRCFSSDGRLFLADFDASGDAALRALALVSPREGALVWLMAEQPLPQAGEPYRRLWDRTEQHAEAITAWKNAAGPMPDLLPGELIRL